MGAVNNRTVAAIRALFTIMDTPQFIQSGATRAPGLLTSERRPRPKRPEPFGEGRRLAVQVAHKLGNPKSCNAESNCEKSPSGMLAVLPHLEITPPRPHCLAGAPGFEPGNGGIKIRCLT